MLLQAGHEVVVATSGRTPLPTLPGWESATLVKAAYGRAGDDAWREIIADIGSEVVIDIIGNDLRALYETTREQCRHLVACGSVYMFGPPRTVPCPDETQAPCPFESYADRYAVMQELKLEAATAGVAFTAIMPPNICGPGKIPLEPMGGRDIEVHRAMSRGEEMPLPLPGSNLVGPCDAEDIARAFALAVDNRAGAADEIFNVGSAYALTAKQFVEAYGQIYGKDIAIRWVDWEDYVTNVSEGLGAYCHFEFNMCPDISKLRSKLGYQPAYTPEQTLARAVDWMRAEGMV
jgi:nucleoside-diphosphate-sugar epimerase